MEENEIELIDYLKIIWKRKWIIILGTLLCMIGAGVVSFLKEPIYEIDAIIQPGKLFIESPEGNIMEFVVEDPQQIADKVNHKSYDALIAIELVLDKTELPAIKGEKIKDTLLTRIWIRNHRVELAKKVLNLLIDNLKEDIDKKIDVEINNIDTKITSNESVIKSKGIEINSKKIEKERINKEVSNQGNKLKIIEKRKEEIMAEMKEAKQRIDTLEKEQISILKKENRTESETLGMLLYSNEVQQNLRYYNSLQEMLANKELVEEDIGIQIERMKETTKQLDNQIEKIDNEIEELKNQIANLKEKKGRIDYTKVVKEPTSSLFPVSPRKKFNVLIACILGLGIFTVLAFFLEYIKTQKLKSEI